MAAGVDEGTGVGIVRDDASSGGTNGDPLDASCLEHVEFEEMITPGERTETTGRTTPGGPLGGPLPDKATRIRRAGEVVVLLPALNEEGAVGHVIDGIPAGQLRARGYEVSVWVVDGQSTDGTLEVARVKGAATFVQDGRGKGSGMRQALDHLLARSQSDGPMNRRFFVMLDADGTYPGEDIVRFVDALESGDDVVLGSRLSGRSDEGAISGLNLLGNHLLSTLARLLFRVPVTDVCTGMWGFREDALRGFGLVAEGFDLEADLFAAACEHNVRLRELSITYHRRIGEPKLIPLRTGVAIAWRLLLRRLNPQSTEPVRTPPASIRALEEAT